MKPKTLHQIDKPVRVCIQVMLLVAVSLVFTPGISKAQGDTGKRPLLEVVRELQEQTPYYYLYRESLLANIDISLDINAEGMLDELRSKLKEYRLDVRLDSERSQVLIVQDNSSGAGSSSRVTIKGHVVDAETGERLPYATVSWKENGILKGVSSNSSGYFNITGIGSLLPLTLRASYVGFEARDITLHASEAEDLDGLTFRLAPKAISGIEIVVSDVTTFQASDTMLSGMVNSRSFNPLGESNAIRSLQSLPSVSINTALNDGLNIRGSTPDGFKVLLDGMTIFNQSHIFGLLDSFNSDAVQSAGFYYDFAPSQIATPTGGTLTLITRTGSRNEPHIKAGASNSSFNATLDGPILKGKGSWLISGRSSYMNSLNWLNNSELIQWGLDIGRPKSLNTTGGNLNSQVVTPGISDARFIDLHGKFYLEGRSGSRFTLSTYFGGDRTEHNAVRKVRDFENLLQFRSEEVTSNNEWYNVLGSLSYEFQLNDFAYNHTMAGVSLYTTDFLKDDFIYSRVTETSGSNQVSVFASPFENRSSINEIKFQQYFDLIFNRFSATAGYEGNYYLGTYAENSFDRNDFFSRTEAFRHDLYMQVDYTNSRLFDLFAGTRLHYYSNGRYLAWSPRTKLLIFPEYPVSVGASYSRNHQFLHRVGIENSVTSDVWILSDSNQPPSAVDHYSAGIYVKPARHTFFQAEAYVKNYENLRLHEVNTQSLSNTFGNTPWYYQNDGFGKGIELLLRNQLGGLTLTNTYVISNMKLQNPFLFNGSPFTADWDRRYRYSASLRVPVKKQVSFSLFWLMASGKSNKLATFGVDEEDRLGPYRRLDASATYDRKIGGSTIQLTLSVFNLLDRENDWYRDYTFLIDESRTVPRLSAVPSDIFDLGIQSSFQVKVSF